jgi:hypothetical protein
MLSVLAFIPAVAFDPMPAVKKIWDWYLAHVPGDGLNRRLQPDKDTAPQSVDHRLCVGEQLNPPS